MTSEHVAKIIVVPGVSGGPTMIRSKTRDSHYGSDEAAPSAVCIALAETIQAIARRELAAGDGFTVRVQFVSSKE